MRLAIPMRPGPAGTLIPQGPPRDWEVIWGRAVRVRGVPTNPADPSTALLEVQDRCGQASLYLVDLNDATYMPRFAIVRGDRCDAEPHALAPNAECGASLCDQEEPEAGWVPVGHAKWPFLIRCGACRSRALQASPEAVCSEGQP